MFKLVFVATAALIVSFPSTSYSDQPSRDPFSPSAEVQVYRAVRQYHLDNQITSKDFGLPRAFVALYPVGASSWLAKVCYTTRRYPGQPQRCPTKGRNFLATWNTNSWTVEEAK